MAWLTAYFFDVQEAVLASVLLVLVLGKSLPDVGRWIGRHMSQR